MQITLRADPRPLHLHLHLALSIALLLSLSALIASAQDGSAFPGAPAIEGPEALAALAAAYPGRFSAPATRGGEAAVALDGEWFRWAGGRLLPEGFAGRAEDWSAQPFYLSPAEPPPVKPLSPEEAARMEAVAAERDKRPPERLPDFYDRLWGCPDEEAAWAKMKRAIFLGKPLLVHRDLLEELASVEAEIVARAAADPEVAAWASSIGTADAYVWREVAGTRSRSFHSYGAAIDLVPAKARGKAWYWLDARRSGLRWYELPYERRIPVPRAVVAAFERRGFVWGGSWRLWDMVHFEYRPEILILSGRWPEIQRRLP